jgi:hypothetical protein
MSNQAKTRLANQIHDMVKKENLILNEGSGNEPTNSSLVGKASNDEMFSETRNRMHNYANEIIDNYESNDNDMPSKKESSGFLLKLVLFAIVVIVAALVVYLINK